MATGPPTPSTAVLKISVRKPISTSTDWVTSATRNQHTSSVEKRFVLFVKDQFGDAIGGACVDVHTVVSTEPPGVFDGSLCVTVGTNTYSSGPETMSTTWTTTSLPSGCSAPPEGTERSISESTGGIYYRTITYTCADDDGDGLSVQNERRLGGLGHGC